MKKWLVRILKWGGAALLLLVVGLILSMSATFYSAPPERVAQLSSAPVAGKTVLVAGATSASGLELVRVLKERGWRVVAMVRASSPTAPLDALAGDFVELFDPGEGPVRLGRQRVVPLLGNCNPRQPRHLANRVLVDAHF